MKKRRRRLSLLNRIDPPTELPPELAEIAGISSVVVWFDSGREVRPGRTARYTLSWVLQPIGNVKLDLDAFDLSISGLGGQMSPPPNPYLPRGDAPEYRAFNPPLDDTLSIQSAPAYVTDLLAAWWGIALLRRQGYPGRVDMVTDGRNAVEMMESRAVPRYVVGGRNLGSELKDAIKILSNGEAFWHFVSEDHTRFLNARQRHQKLALREIQAKFGT